MKRAQRINLDSASPCFTADEEFEGDDMADGTFIPAFKFLLIALKILSVIGSLALFSITAGWLRGADNLAFPGLGLIVATPLLIIFLAVIEILLVVAFGTLSALLP